MTFTLPDYDDYEDDDEFRPHASLGANTYRKARGGMSLASGYFTPSRKSAITRRSDTIETLKLSPRSKARSLKSEYRSVKGSMDMSVYDTSRAGSESPKKKAFCKSCVCLLYTCWPYLDDHLTTSLCLQLCLSKLCLLENNTLSFISDTLPFLV